MPGDKAIVGRGYAEWHLERHHVHPPFGDFTRVLLINYEQTSLGWCWSVRTEDGQHFKVIPERFLIPIKKPTEVGQLP